MPGSLALFASQQVRRRTLMHPGPQDRAVSFSLVLFFSSSRLPLAACCFSTHLHHCTLYDLIDLIIATSWPKATISLSAGSFSTILSRSEKKKAAVNKEENKKTTTMLLPHLTRAQTTTTGYLPRRSTPRTTSRRRRTSTTTSPPRRRRRRRLLPAESRPPSLAAGSPMKTGCLPRRSTSAARPTGSR